MGGKPSAEKSLSDMIRDLGFIGDKSVQFAIADTYKGFQNLVDAFSQVSEGYFVKDKQALESESRSLYEQICTKCLKNFVHVKPAVIGRSAKAKKEKSKKGFFSGLFSRS
jgi:hypothetical protein